MISAMGCDEIFWMRRSVTFINYVLKIDSRRFSSFTFVNQCQYA